MLRKLTLILTIITLTVTFGQTNDFSLGQDAAGCFRVDDNAALDVTGDFTVEAWVYMNDAAASGRFIADRADEWELFIYSSSIRFDLNGGTIISTGVLSQNEWHHVAVVRAGSRTLIFADGVKMAGADLALTEGTTPVVVGGQDSWYSAAPNSIFDELKFSNVAVYDTAGFTPSTTAPLGSDANTVFYFQFEDNTELPPLDDGPLTLSTLNGQTDGTEPVTADNYVAAPAGLPLAVPVPDIVINEFDTNTSSAEYVELYNSTASAIDLSAAGYVLAFVNGYDDKAYQATALTGTIPANGFYVITETGVTTVEGYTADQVATWGSFQNGVDGLALVKGAAAADFPGSAVYGTELAAVSGATQEDAVIYGTAADTGLETEFGLAGILITNGSAGSSSRVTDGQGGAAYANTDWHITATRTPGTTNEVAPPTYNPYTIVEIQTPDTGGDASQHADEYVETSGIITALTSYSFYMQDGTADYSGIYIYVSGDVSAYALGDNVTVQGVVGEYNGLTQIASIADITVNSSGNDLPAPIVLVTNTLAEGHEGMLATIFGECTAVSTNAGTDHWAFKLDDGSGDALVDDQVFSAAETAATVGSNYDVVGVVNYYYDAFTVNPRDADDVVETPTTPQGSICADPIALTLPAVALAGTTEGFGDDYGTSPCNNSYMGGDDIVYEFTLAEDGYLSGSVAGNYAGLHILDDCPDASPTCIASGTGSSGGAFSYAPVTAGTYYAIVSNWPTPQFITFTLDLGFVTTLPPGLACDDPLDYGAVNSVEATGALGSGETVWYSFAVDDAYESILVSLCASDFDTKLYIWLDCDSSSYEYYNDDNYTVCTTGSRSAIEITG
ncbi:MAG: lamin tail domain-containing protein, partial [Candidatus Marinimicrobia bacterium]|nr:lamin tail domain-containing protein [Candidatus Neomarinimicrobiota bacterium]